MNETSKELKKILERIASQSKEKLTLDKVRTISPSFNVKRIYGYFSTGQDNFVTLNNSGLKKLEELEALDKAEKANIISWIALVISVLAIVASILSAIYLRN